MRNDTGSVRAPMLVSLALSVQLTVAVAEIAAQEPKGSPMLVTTTAAGTRPALSRADLSRLKKADRAEVFAVLGSFDDRGLSEPEFSRRALDLLDPQRVPGLDEARAAGADAKAVELVYQACRTSLPVPAKPRISAGTRAAADELLANQFTFYQEKHPLPADIDWDFNPGTRHWGHDLNRFSYLTTLTQAYLATDDARYSRKALDLILDWVAKCDVGKCFVGTPYVWGSYLNNAIHCQAWCNSLRVLLACEQIGPTELLRVLKSLHDQFAYLEIVTNGHAGNWPTIGCSCMLAGLVAIPVLRDTDRFAEHCVRNMKDQIADQVLPDGVQYELTPHYHRVVVNNLLSFTRSLRALGRSPDAEMLETLRKMVHYQQQTTVPDGKKQVGFNDSDPGCPGSIERGLTEIGLRELVSPPERLGPEVFPYAGVAFLRQCQAAGDLYLAFDAGPYGKGHQHEDKLGFWLFAYGRNFIVDPGRHLYDWSEKSYYPYLRTTTAHSTLRIDGLGQYSAGRPETWVAHAPLDLGWSVQDGEIRASGVYDFGYGGKDRLVAVVHRREIVFVRERCWVVFDAVTGEGDHLVESRFQFAPGTLQLDGTSARTTYDDANLLLQAVPMRAFSDIHVEQGQDNPRGGWYSDSYGKIEPAPALSMSVRTSLPWYVATLLFPYRGVEPPNLSFEFDGDSVLLRDAELGEVRVSRRKD